MTSNALPPDLGRFVDRQVALGKYPSVADAICEDVRLLQARERRLEELRQEILPALERIKRGEGIEIDFEELKAELHREFDHKRAAAN